MVTDKRFAADALAEQSTSLVREETVGRIRRLTMSAPRGPNLLTESMMTALAGALDRAGVDRGVHVVVIAADGPAFSAGHDLKAMAGHRNDSDGGRDYFRSVFVECGMLMHGILRNPKPIIAEIGAVAVAAGCQLVAACDLAVAGESARFGTTGVSYGLFCTTPGVALGRCVGRKAALELLFTGDLIDAQRAHQIGLVNKVVPDDELTTATMELAGRIARKSTAVLALGKQSFYAQMDEPVAKAYWQAAEAMVENLMMSDCDEGIAAFIEKRPPAWSLSDD